MSASFRTLLAALVAVLVGLAPARAAISIISSGAASSSTYDLAGEAYEQDFDALPASGNFTWANNTTLPGWYAVSAAGTLTTAAVSIDGTGNPADLTLASVGTTADPERALSYHTRVNSAPTYLGLAFVNNANRELTSFTVAYTPEQWREATNARTLTVAVQYRVGAVAADLNATTGWTTLPGLGFSTLNGSGTASANLTAADIPVSVPSGATLWFRWVFTNTAASATNSHDLLAIDNVSFSATATAVDTAPSFTLQPLSRLIAISESVTFNATAVGHPAPTYQWFKGVDSIPGATSASYTIDSVTVLDAGAYHVVATNSVTSVPSATAVLTVSTTPLPPSVLTPPASIEVNLGQPATFTVLASGSSPLSYQWAKFNGAEFVAIPSATSSTYTINAVTALDAGSYRVVVTGPAGPASAATGGPATLAVISPPVITAPPAAVSVNLGQPASFTVGASGTAPLTYQWFRNGEPVPASNNPNLNFAAVTAADDGLYFVSITNAAGVATSTPVALTVILPPAPPIILSSPVSRAGVLGGTVTFSVTVSGTAPFSYAWFKNDELLTTTTIDSLTLTGLAAADAGSYRVTVTNTLGSAPSAAATLTVSPAPAPAAFNVQGFAEATTGGGIVAETHATYRKVYNAADFRAALTDKTTKVIEIMNDLNLGWNEIPASERTGRFRSNTAALLHPDLIASGVSTIDIQDTTNLTIFSANGATIRHAEFNVKRCTNLIIRNLRFSELWEWDESTKGDYDKNDWDFITVDINSTNVWIDHCDFGKAYDGVVDIKSGSNRVTLSWCRFLEDDGEPNSFVRRQIQALEANRASHAMYNFLRTNGFSMEDIIAIVRSQKKGHLVGANNFDSSNALLSVTLHHNLYVGMQDRLPRLRGGNAHSYNLYVDNRNAYAASQLYAARVAAMSSTNATKLSNGTYKFGVTQNGAISTESGAVLLEKSIFEGVRYALRNNQTDITNPAYTGRIRGEDLIFRFGATDFRGGSDTPGHPLGPTQAPQILPFAWNGFTTLPYVYTPDDPTELPAILAVGAGSGVLQWDKSNWLRPNYPVGDIFPAIAQHPQSLNVAPGGTAIFTVTASATPAPTYQWLKGTAPILNATTATLTLNNITTLDAANYSVRVTNIYGSVTSIPAALVLETASPPAFSSWAGGQGLTGPAAEPTADTDGDGIPLLLEYALGLDPTTPTPATALPALGLASEGLVTFRFTRPKSLPGITYLLENTASLTTEWTPLATPPTVESQTSTTETLAVTLPTTNGPVFVRLRVTQTP